MNPVSEVAPSVLASLGLPNVHIHHSQNHFDFAKGGRRILVIGPMGSGKTEFSARVWRDSKVALRKSGTMAKITTTAGADRRNVMFIRSSLDGTRFPDYPDDALAYRGGFERLGPRLAKIRDSFDLERLLQEHPEVGTWIIDEASFYDERLAYVVQRESTEKGRIFIFPTLILNFRRDLFNPTARLILDTATDIMPLTAYCEHPDCLADSLLTYRYYLLGDQECPAPFFDPLIIIGGDRVKHDPREPNYATRCEKHHYLPGKEYTYLVLKPLGQEAARGNTEPLRGELRLLRHDIMSSALASEYQSKYTTKSAHGTMAMRTLELPCMAEKALLYLFAEQNLLSREVFAQIARELHMDLDYLNARLRDAGREVLGT